MDDGHDDIRAGILRVVGFGFCVLLAVAFCSLGFTLGEVVERVACLFVGGCATIGAFTLAFSFARRRLGRGRNAR